MKEKKLHFVVTYYTTAEAMATERLCKDKKIEGRLIPAPRSVSADCGIAFASKPSSKDELVRALEERKIEVQGYYDLYI